MQDVFYEESCKSNNREKKSVLVIIYKVLSILFYVVAVLWAVIMLNFLEIDNLLLTIIFIFLPSIILAFNGYLFNFLRNKIIVDYDYTFVSGSVRFAKVFGEAKRKEIICFDCNDIEKIGFAFSNTFEKFNQMPDIEKKILTQNNTPSSDKNFYYIVINFKSKKYIITFECSKKFIQLIIRFSKQYTFEEDFLSKISQEKWYDILR